MKIAGIDADTKAITIYVLAQEGNREATASMRLECKGRRAEDRFAALVQELCTRTSELFLRDCDYVYVERPFVGPNRKAAIDMGMVIGALRSKLVRLEVPHSLVDPAVWKTRTLGTSRVSKDEIRQWAMVRFGMGAQLIQDYYDAAGIAAYGMQVLGDGRSKSSGS